MFLPCLYKINIKLHKNGRTVSEGDPVKNKTKKKKGKRRENRQTSDSLNLVSQNSKQLLRHRSEGTPLIAVTIAETHKCD